jgi:hypothetical protein
MAGARRVPVRSFGSEVPEPTVQELAAWIVKRKGTGGDLTSYLLEESLEPQERVDFPCAGGRIYRARILETIRGLEEETLVREPSVDTVLIEDDARWGASRRKALWFCLPAPHLLGIRDEFYHDRGEFCEGIATCYRQILRAMRDTGTGRHVLLGDKVHEDEMEKLAGPRAFFFYPHLAKEDLPSLLESQSAAAIPRDLLPEVLGLLDEYDLRSLSILDGKKEDLVTALEQLDPDQISLGGYCREGCGDYWKGLLARAVIPR